MVSYADPVDSSHGHNPRSHPGLCSGCTHRFTRGFTIPRTQPYERSNLNSPTDCHFHHVPVANSAANPTAHLYTHTNPNTHATDSNSYRSAANTDAASTGSHKHSGRTPDPYDDTPTLSACAHGTDGSRAAGTEGFC